MPSLVYGVLHLADMFRNPKMHLPSLRDWSKIPHILDGTWPKPVPPRYVWDGADTYVTCVFNKLRMLSCYVVLDTEYTPDRRVWLMAVSGPHGEFGVQWFVTPQGFETWQGLLTDLVGEKTVVFQNTTADMRALKTTFGIPYTAYKAYEDTMLAHAVLWPELPHDLGFLASLYSPYNKMKHLAGTDPALYNWGDVIDTAAVWEGLKEEFKRDPESEAVYRTQSLPLVPIILNRLDKGIRTNQARAQSAAREYAGRQKDGLNLAHAYAGWSINPGSDDQLKLWLYVVEGIKTRRKRDKDRKVTIDKDAVAEMRGEYLPFDAQEEEREPLTLERALTRIEQGAHPLLEARVVYAKAQHALSHYVIPCLAPRIYPEFLIHAQETGRWSIDGPPLAQFPNDLRDLILPDEGEAWISFDWDQIELRILAALVRDEKLLEAFEKGYDVHTINCCDLFGLDNPADLRDPHTSVEGSGWRAAVRWQGKDDPRRVFAKRFVYRLVYGGDPQTAYKIPGASLLQLDKATLVKRAQAFLYARREYFAWRTKVQQEILMSRHPTVRTWTGRRRRLLVSMGMNAVREGWNAPMQGGALDILNLTIIRIAREVPYAEMVYTCHDAGTEAVPVEKVAEAQPIIKEIVEAPHRIGGRDVVIPAKFKPVVYGERAA